jgi:hypothetical protein
MIQTARNYIWLFGLWLMRPFARRAGRALMAEALREQQRRRTVRYWIEITGDPRIGEPSAVVRDGVWAS